MGLGVVDVCGETGEDGLVVCRFRLEGHSSVDHYEFCKDLLTPENQDRKPILRMATPFYLDRAFEANVVLQDNG